MKKKLMLLALMMLSSFAFSEEVTVSGRLKNGAMVKLLLNFDDNGVLQGQKVLENEDKENKLVAVQSEKDGNFFVTFEEKPITESDKNSVVKEKLNKLLNDLDNKTNQNVEKQEEVKKEEPKQEEVAPKDNLKVLEDYTKSDVQYTLNLGFDKYFDKELNHFVYFKHRANVREKATTRSKRLTSLDKGTRVPTKRLVAGLDGRKWYEIRYNGDIAYVESNQVIKRAFNWQRAIEKANQNNKFIVDAIINKKDIYNVESYVSLNTTTSGKKDKYGNSANQSIRAYHLNDDDYINLQDRSLFTIERRDDKFMYIKTLSYGDEIFRVPLSYRRNIRKANITNEINKFIYIDRHSQTQVSIEKNKETGIYNVQAVGYVTTGIEKGVGFVTPYGDYLVAYTKPVMAYASDTETEPIMNAKGEVVGQKNIIVGDARHAIRFSGGGYMHGIPSLYEPKDNREARKKVTASKLGSFPLSHKCVRNEDDVELYLYKWVNGNNKAGKNGFTMPEENVIVIVE